MKTELDWKEELLNIIFDLGLPEKIDQEKAYESINALLLKYAAVYDNDAFDAGWEDAVYSITEYLKRGRSKNVIAGRKIISEPGDSIIVTEITLTDNVRKSLNLGNCKL